MKTRISGLLALALMASMASTAKADFVVNGGFEVPSIGSSFATFGLGSTAITGWTVVSGTQDAGSGSVDMLGTYVTPYAGLQSIDLDGTGSIAPGGVTQTISGLTVGFSYSLTFAYANNPAAGSAGAVVTIAGLTQNITHSGSTFAAMNYTLASYTFVATATSQALTFASTDPASDQSGIVLDAVSINALTVPEPASCTMLGLGAIGLACFARSRRRSA